MRVAVTGGGGVLGSAMRDLRPRWDFLTRADCDVRRRGDVFRALESLAPDVVVHTAALTDHAHPNAAEVIETNIIGTQHVAQLCEHFGIPLVYTSTHYVYPGTAGNYHEDNTPRPIGAYAWSKLAGEAWAATTRHSLIVRGSWYTRETRLDRWAARGALTDAYCSRERVQNSAAKIVALVEAEAWLEHSVINIGFGRRSFAQILSDEGYTGFRRLSRELFDDACANPYPFPADTSVNTARFDELDLSWRVH